MTDELFSSGWVKLWRKTIASPIWQYPDAWRLFEWCLLSATHKTHKVAVGSAVVELQPGELVFGRKVASKETHLSQQTVRTVLSFLLTQGALKSTIHSTKHFSVVTVCNWASYQDDDREANQPPNQALTNHQPGANQALTTNKKGNKGKTVENVKKEDAAEQIGGDADKPKEAAGRVCEPNPYFDAVCEIWKLLPEVHGGKRIGKLTAQFKALCEAAGKDHTAICRYHKRLAEYWPEMTITPDCLVKHWGTALSLNAWGRTDAEMRAAGLTPPAPTPSVEELRKIMGLDA